MPTEPTSWIIEGAWALVRKRADWVILLDTPRHVCFWRYAKRNVRYLLKSRSELPAFGLQLIADVRRQQE